MGVWGAEWTPLLMGWGSMWDRRMLAPEEGAPAEWGPPMEDKGVEGPGPPLTTGEFGMFGLLDMGPPLDPGCRGEWT